MATIAKKAQIAQKRVLLIESIYRDILYHGNMIQLGEREEIEKLLSFYYKKINKDSSRFNKILMKCQPK